MVFSFDFRLLIASTLHVPVGVVIEFEGVEEEVAVVGATGAESQVHSGEHEETSLHMRWGFRGDRLQILLAAVQPPQCSVVPHVYLLHLRWGACSLSCCDSKILYVCCSVFRGRERCASEAAHMGGGAGWHRCLPHAGLHSK